MTHTHKRWAENNELDFNFNQLKSCKNDIKKILHTHKYIRKHIERAK